MKYGRSLQELAIELDRQAKVKKDYVATAGAMQMTAVNENFDLVIGNTPFQLNENAHRQLGLQLKIPAPYYERMRAENPGLLMANVNGWFQQSPDTRRMVRTLDGTARAILSDRYRRIDNYEVAQTVLPIISEMQGARIESCELTDTRMYIKVVNERIQTEVVPGDIVQAGILISNSEVGMGSVSVKPLIYRLVCTNGMVADNGSAQSPSWSNYNSSQLTIGGTSSATNAGSYSATFTPTSNYKWSDGTTTAKSASWTIGKATGSITLSASRLSLTYPKTSGTITVTRPGSGTVTASSGSTNIATVSVSGTTITVTAKATGSATITVNVGADTNYTAPSSKTFTVAVTLVSKTLSSNSWAVIKAVSDAGQGANYWSVGATKSVTINGKVGATTISSLKVDAFIIGFNHNSGKEGSNRIHFLLGKISGKFVGLVDSSYGSATSTSGAFTMNTSNTNSGGWRSSQMRSKVLGSASSPTSPTANTLMAALPSDLRAVMKSCTKYTDNKGGGNTASNVSSTTDYLFLLSEYEVFATHQYCNDAEPNYQAQYDYFKAGNSKVANKHSATGTAAVWWLRSPTYYIGSDNYFCEVSSSGSLDFNAAYNAYGVVPGFVV